MTLHPYIGLARELTVPIRDLNAILVPLAEGWRDSNGQPVPIVPETQAALAAKIQQAHQALQHAQTWLENEQERTANALQSRD